MADYAMKNPGLRARIIAPTFGDGVASCIEGPSGLKRFCPNGKWRPSEPGGAMFDFGNGSKVWVIGTPTPNDVDRLRALGNIHCLTGAALVTTVRGDVPIAEVCRGELVLTRQGWRPVEWSGQTGMRKDLYELVTDAGLTLHGTSDHRVWTTRGWVAMAFLKEGDMIQTCRPTSPLASCPRPAIVRVLRSSPILNAEPTPVYDLTVEGEHEFYANGILVHNCDFFEEFAANRQGQAAWDQAELSRRNPTIPNKAVVATTPRPIKLLKKWFRDPAANYTVVTSFQNRYGDPKWQEKIRKLEGTRWYRQEVLGEILDDIAGALWTLADIERSKVDYAHVDLVRYAIGVDPPSGSGTCGIVVVGADMNNHLYVVADRSLSDVMPNQWAQQVIDAHDEFALKGGTHIVAERNNGDRMVRNTLDQLRKGLPIKTVWASEGKRTRAEPISILWEIPEPGEQVAHFPADESYVDMTLLTDQLTSWVPPGGENPPSDYSPDRLDALVWAGHHLRGSALGEARVARPRGQLQGW